MVANEPKNTVSSFQFSRAKKLVKFVCAEECAKNLTDRFCAFFAGAEYSFLFPGKKHVTRNPTKHARYQKCITTPQMLYRITVVHVYCGYYLRSFKIINLDNINNYNTQNTAHKTQHTAHSTQHTAHSTVFNRIFVLTLFN